MGEMQVPDEALYGASTQRALLNFPISDLPMPAAFIKGMALVKSACASANEALGKLDEKRAGLICRACEEIFEGKHDAQFPVDVFQTGSGTSSNMNINEVVSNLACRFEGTPIGSKDPVHPNDHVNMGQSSNDIIPTVLHVSTAMAIQERLVPPLKQLAESLHRKSREFESVVKIGRTHLMDATPLTLGQEFSGYAHQLDKSVKRAERSVEALMELAIGGTAVGTGINCHPEFPKRVCQIIAEKTGLPFREADNHFEAQGGRDDSVEVAGNLTTIAASLTKIANDIRLMGSGPRSGLGELSIPATQPGSSIMPGKVNPVMSEMLVQACIYATGLCQGVSLAGRDGHFELNVTIPLIGYSLHKAIKVLGNGARIFSERCIEGIEANEVTCRKLVDDSLMLVTALNPYIGYDKAAMVAKKAFAENKTLREVILEDNLMDREDLEKALDPFQMIRPKH